MGVGPVGRGPSAADLAGLARTAEPVRLNAGTPANLSQALAAAVDQAVLAALSPSDLSQLALILEPPQSPQTAARTADLLQSALTETASGNVSGALDALSQFAALQPLRAQAVSSTPGLETIRPQVDALLARLSHVARLDAEGRLAHASLSADEFGASKLPGWDTRPETLVLLGTQLLESGTHANFIRAADLAQAVIDGTRWAPAPAPAPATEAATRRATIEMDPAGSDLIRASLQRSWRAAREGARPRLRALWRRAPLLVLLLGWLAVGVVAGSLSWAWRGVAPDSWPASSAAFAVEIWGIGFLALVLFGFYMRVRNVRF